jgi:hypothetical protein
MHEMTTSLESDREGRADASSDQTRTRVEALDYIRSMLGELSEIARRERFDMVAYLVDMACVEAADILAREAAPRRRRTSRV